MEDVKVKVKFQEGDQIICVNHNEVDHHLSGWPRLAEVMVGDKLTVTGAKETGSITTEECDFFLPQDNFELMPNVVVIVLRRESNEKTVLKALDKAGFTWHNKKPALEFSPSSRGGRTINVWLEDKRLGMASWVGAKANAPKIIMSRSYARSINADPNRTVFINTKPSVKEAINELQKYI